MSSELDFSSDNTSGVAPRVWDALLAASTGAASAYGQDPWTERLGWAFAELFECNLTVFPVLTGTAANALALAAITPPFGAIFCHEMAHIACDECGAPEFYSGGAKLVPVAGGGGKVAPAALKSALASMPAGIIHHNQPAALSLTQSTECGTLYSLDEIHVLTEIAKSYGLAVHMDGARFANAVASLGCTPADMTWRAGIDVLSFGGTKNGAMGAEAIIYFSQSYSQAHIFRQKRAGQVPSKTRFVSAQLLALLQDGYWLELASHANAMAHTLAEGAVNHGYQLVWPTEANGVFVELSDEIVAALHADHVGFHSWASPNAQKAYRFVSSFATTCEQVDQLLEILRRVGP